MALEHTFSIITMDVEKLKKLKKHLEENKQPDGVCIYALEITKYNEYYSIKGLLRRTVLEELKDEIDKSGIRITDEDCFVIHYEDRDDIHAVMPDYSQIPIAEDWIPEVVFTEYGRHLPDEVRDIIRKEYGYNQSIVDIALNKMKCK